VALARALGARLHALGRRPRFAGLSRLLARAHAAWSRRPPVWRALALGVLTSLLPCGWLWAFVVSAAGTASPWGGALVMAAFWLGTVPALLGLGLGLGLLLAPLKKRLPLLTPALLVALGLVLVVWRAQMPRLVPPAAQAGEPPAPTPPCHHASPAE
ncbi:MAG: sulfite exporter TauE/SafE family protein, partial [Myxococcales bacterium]|nr:sulfite exporter TauE/SafE family protein [Myxococcales bacterium]